MNCPVEFETKTTINPLTLVLMGGFAWGMSALVVVEVLKSFLPPKEWLEVYGFSEKFVLAICLGWFITAIRINILAVMLGWWKYRAKHLQIVLKYYIYYIGFTILVMGALMGIIVLLMGTGKIDYSTILDSATDLNPKDRMVQLKFLLENSIPRFALSLVTTCFLAPVIEEIFFRRFLFVALRKKISFIPALLITAISFMAVHPNVALGAIGGIYLGYVYEKGKSLPANILIHSTINLTVIAISMILTQSHYKYPA